MPPEATVQFHSGNRIEDLTFFATRDRSTPQPACAVLFKVEQFPIGRLLGTHSAVPRDLERFAAVRQHSEGVDRTVAAARNKVDPASVM
jgi:hypothetical protein